MLLFCQAEMIKEGGFRLTQSLSSLRKLLSMLPASDLINHVNMDNDSLPVEQTLGVFCDAEHASVTDSTATLKLTPNSKC